MANRIGIQKCIIKILMDNSSENTQKLSLPKIWYIGVLEEYNNLEVLGSTFDSSKRFNKHELQLERFNPLSAKILNLVKFDRSVSNKIEEISSGLDKASQKLSKLSFFETLIDYVSENNIEIVFWDKTYIHDTCEGYTNKNKIACFIEFGKIDFIKLLGTLFHEIMHFTVDKIFNNSSLPFYASILIDESALEEEQIWHELVNKHVKSKNGEYHHITNSYSEGKYVSELPAFIFESLVGQNCISDNHSSMNLTLIKAIWENIFKKAFLENKLADLLNQNYLIEVFRTEADKPNSLETIKYLIQNGAKTNLQDDAGNTLMHFACRSKKIMLELIEFFIKSGAKVNLQNDLGNTPMHFVCENEGVTSEIIKFLIENGAKINLQNNAGNTPVHFAFENEDVTPEIFKFLTANGGKINLQNKAGDTPLNFACQSEKITPELIKLLISNKGDPNIANKYGRQCFKLLERNESLNLQSNEIIELLTPDNENTDSTTHKVVIGDFI